MVDDLSQSCKVLITLVPKPVSVPINKMRSTLLNWSVKICEEGINRKHRWTENYTSIGQVFGAEATAAYES